MADQQVRVNLDVRQTGDATRQMRDLASETDRAARAQRQLNDGRRMQPQAQAGPPPGAAQGQLALSGQGQAVNGQAVIGLVQQVIQAAQQQAASISEAISRASDPTMDATGRARGAVESFRGGGLLNLGDLAKTFNDARDAISGTTTRLKQLQVQLERNLKTLEIEARQRSQLDALRTQQAQTFAQVTAAEGLPRVAFQGADRSTVAGERRQAELERLLPAQLDLRRAEVQKGAADTVAAGLGRRIDERQAEVDAAEGRRRAARARFEAARGDTSGAGRETRNRANADEAAAVAEILAKKKELVALEQQRQQALTAGVQAEAAQQKALLALSQARLQTLTETENRVKGQAQAFGQLNAAEKEAAVRAAEQLKEKGLASLSEDQRGLLQRAGAGEMLAKEFEQAALKDDRFKRFQDATGERADLDAIRRERNTLQAEVVARVQLDEEAVAQQLAKALEPVFKRLEELTRGLAEAERQRVQVEERLKQGGQR